MIMIKICRLNFRYFFVPGLLILLAIIFANMVPSVNFSYAQPINTLNQSIFSNSLFNNTLQEGNVLNPSLIELISKFTPPTIVEVRPGVYSAVGFGQSNVIMIEGNDGIIVIDSGSSVEQAKKILSEFRKITDKPTTALVYTNGKNYNIGGGKVFVNESIAKGHNVDVIANSHFMENIFPMVGQVAKQKSLYKLYASGILLSLSNSSDYPVANGLGPISKLGNISFVPPNVTFNDTLETSYSGINMSLISAPGTSPEQIFVWLPQQDVIISSDLVYPSFPKIYSMSGVEDVDIQSWINSIDQMISLNSSYLVPGHLQHASGKNNVFNILVAYRDGISYLVQQTIRLINKGFDANEISEILQLPPYLKNNPWLQERLGEIPWTIKQIYSYIVGWNSGDATWFNPVSNYERGVKIVNGFGGVNSTIDQIKHSIEKKEYNWAAELSTYLLYGFPDNDEVKMLKADALRKLGWENPTVEGRNWYLTQANILEGKINASVLQKIPNTNLVNEVMKTVSLDDLLFNMMFKLDPVKSPSRPNFGHLPK